MNDFMQDQTSNTKQKSESKAEDEDDLSKNAVALHVVAFSTLPCYGVQATRVGVTSHV